MPPMSFSDVGSNIGTDLVLVIFGGEMVREARNKLGSSSSSSLALSSERLDSSAAELEGGAASERSFPAVTLGIRVRGGRPPMNVGGGGGQGPGNLPGNLPGNPPGNPLANPLANPQRLPHT